MAAQITLNWVDNSAAEEGVRVYRSTSPMTVGSLPSPLATLAPNTVTYVDTAITTGTTYYYRVSSYIGSTEVVSSEVSCVASFVYSAKVLADSPLLYWRFDETSGTVAADSSGNSRPGTIAGAVIGQPSLLTSYPAGKSMQFDGVTGKQVSRAYESWMALTTISVEAIIKPTTGFNGTARTIVCRYGEVTATSGNNWILRLDAGKPAFYVYVSGAWRSAVSSTVLTIDTTYHLVGTYDGTTVRIYVNGTQVASTAFSGTIAVGTDSLIRVGQAGAYSNGSVDERWRGYIDEVAIYSGALSAARVSSHYASV